MKKILSFILCFAMILSITAPAFATEVSSESDSFMVMDIDGGNLYNSVTEEKVVTILTEDERHMIDISIKYPEQPDTVYHWAITDYPEDSFQPTSQAFWDQIVAYAEERLDAADMIHFTEVVYDEPIEVPQTRSSAVADLEDSLAEALDVEQYYKKIRYYKPYQGQDFEVYEDMDFRIFKDRSKSWTVELTVSAIITGVIGLAVAPASLIATLCGVYGLAVSAFSLIPPGSMDIYVCQAMCYRYVTVNNSNYHYNITYKVTSLKGYDDTTSGNTNRAYVDPKEIEVEYAHGESYFNDYYEQVLDAYDVFRVIGQKP